MKQLFHSYRLLFVFLVVFGVLATDGIAGVFASEIPPRITPDGGIMISDGSVVPPFPQSGKWTELEVKSSDRYEIHHFIYLVPTASPAIELFVKTDRLKEAPDGAFEIGMIGGYAKAFAAKAGFKYEEPAFEEHRIGQARSIRTVVKLSDERRSLWIYAYGFLREPALTFLAIRTSGTEKAEIENYLAGIEFK